MVGIRLNILNASLQNQSKANCRMKIPSCYMDICIKMTHFLSSHLLHFIFVPVYQPDMMTFSQSPAEHCFFLPMHNKSAFDQI